VSELFLERSKAALVQDGRVVEFHLERQSFLVGNIYEGRVIDVVPGMEAAFVDIGLSRTAFLQAHDALVSEEDLEVPLQGRLRRGQQLLVQVTRPPVGSKGARLSAQVVLPGALLILLPQIERLGVSQRIRGSERKRLRRMLQRICPKGMGLIARTAARGRSEQELRVDLERLLARWESIGSRQGRPPRLLHAEADFPLRLVRDLCGEELERVVTDDPELLRRLEAFLAEELPFLRMRLELSPQPALQDLAEEFDRALSPRVRLRCGGYICVEETEALTAVDVNTGSFVGNEDLERTALRTNLEAAQEIARQLRIRNIGGLIAIDFIDLRKETHRQQVLRTLRESLRSDRMRTKVVGMSPLGVVELTRKRNGEPLRRAACQPCPTCGGLGYLRSSEV